VRICSDMAIIFNSLEFKPEILWNGNHLDGKLTILTTPEYSESKQLNEIDFVFIAQDGTEFSGSAAVLNTEDAVINLLRSISDLYLRFVQSEKEKRISNGAYLN
jgi:hypothetical protein